MKIRRLAILFIAGGCLSACLSTSSSEVKNKTVFFEIHNVDQMIEEKSDSERYIKLNTVMIENWPLDLKPSKTSSVKMGKKFIPDGPTTWLYIADEKNRVDYWLLETFQGRVFFEGWRIAFNDGVIDVANTAKEVEAKVSIKEKLPLELSGKAECYISWLKQMALRQPANNIADDVADFKTQLIIYCNKF